MPAELIFEGIAGNVQSFRGTYPNVPLAEGVDYQALVEGDSNPMFITLPIGKIGAESRNGRTYQESHVNAIHDAIVNDRIGGIRGHLRSEARAYDSPATALKWVGAMFENGLLWGKAYVLPTAAATRDEIRVAKATNSNVATSIYGTAVYDGESVDFADAVLTVETIDFLPVAPRAGIPDTEAVPRVTRESEGDNHAEAGPDDLQIGDYVRWSSSGGRATGRVERIERSGTIEVPDTRVAVDGTADDPAAMIRIYDGARRTDTLVGHRFSTLTKTTAPSGGDSEEAQSDRDENMRGEADNPYEEGHKRRRMEADNMEQTAITEADVQRQIEEARANDLAEISRLNSELAEQRRALAELTPVREMLGNPDYPVVALQAILDVRDNLSRENGQLLEAYIRTQVAEAIAIKDVRPMVETLVTQRTPATRAEVDAALTDVRSREEVKALLKAQTARQMGPAQPAPQGQPDDIEETTGATTATAMWG